MGSGRRLMFYKALLVLLVCTAAFSQSQNTGFPPFGSFQGGDFDSVDLQNLNANMLFPVVSHPGRGLDFHFMLAYNSLIWSPTTGSGAKWKSVTGWSTDGPVGTLQFQRTTFPCVTEEKAADSNWVYTDPSGTPHPFNVTRWAFGPTECPPLTQMPTSGYATDGSGYFLDSSSGQLVYAPDGTKAVFGTTTTTDANGNFVIHNPTITDPNGNSITSTTTLAETDWLDTLGQIALKISNQHDASNALIETDYQRLAVDGSYQTVAVKYQQFNVKTNFGCNGVAEASSTSASPLVSEIDLPNSQKFTFSYESTPGFAGYVTARLQQITLPNGGTVTYQYPGANGGINCADGTFLNLTRVVNDGITTATWTYTRDLNANTTTITAPQLPYDTAANQTVVAFDFNGREISRKIFQGAATGIPLRTIITSWASNHTPASTTVILEDGSTQSQVETVYDSNGNVGSVSTGNLLVMKEHDWAAGSPGPVIRTTNFGYVSDSAHTGLHIINKQTSKTVADATGTIKYRTDALYDEPSHLNKICVSGALQHDDNQYGCSFTTRGLMTSLTTYTDSGTPSGGVTGNFNYDSVGNLVSTEVNSVQQKQWNFSLATQYAFPDSIITGPPTGPQLTLAATYSVATGQIATSTDFNGKITTYSHVDPGHIDRLTDDLRPDNAHIVYSYDDVQHTSTVSSPVNSSNVVKRITALDALGRTSTTTIEDINNAIHSITQTQYDALGRVFKTSNPYLSSPQFWTATQYDALGRPTTKIMPDGTQESSQYVLNTVLLTDANQNQRKKVSNGINQLTEVDEPGDSFAGTQASGSITINDPLNSKPTIPATSGSGSVTISGAEGVYVTCVKTSNGGLNCTTHYDTGTLSITVTVGGTAITKSSGYGQNTTAQSLATALANQFSQDANFKNVSVVANSSTSYTINLTASAVGSATNYSYSATYGPKTDFTATTAGVNFTGGVDGQVGATDSGTITLTLGNFTTAPVCYGPSCNANAAQVATALAQALGGSGSPVHSVSASGSTIFMTANQFSAAWNVVLTATPHTNDPSDFPNASFASSGSMQGGADPYPSGLAHPHVTTYSYGVLNNLLQITQGSQSRTYSYDGMGRIIGMITPEEGQVNYQLDGFGLLQQRTDARGVITNYGYDTLNRLHTITYNVGTTGVSQTANLTYSYGTDSGANNNGRLISVLEGTGAESLAYDLFGRVTQLQKAVGGVTYTIGYGYDLAGNLISITYPSNHIVQQSFNSIGQLCEIAPQTSGCGTATAPYATGFIYNPASQVTGFAYGNGVAVSAGYSPDRLQMTSLTYAKNNATLFGLNYFFKIDPASCPTATLNNGGQIQCITDAVDAGRNLNYTYDNLGRLVTASSKGSTAYPAWSQSFSYDRYGNRTALNGNGVNINPATNQVLTWSYDQSGNVLYDGQNTMTYDAEGRMISNSQGGSTSTYTYDAKGLRVVKASNGATTVYVYSGPRVLAEYPSGADPTAPSREYVYSGSTLLARIEAGATTYYHSDHLSNRVLTNDAGSAIGQLATLPFGESWYGSDVSKWAFTSYERDSESQNAYALAREYVNQMGRFSSADPISGSTENPQSLNRYSYTANDPINRADTTGQFITPWTRFLDPAAFGSNPAFGSLWDEFTVLETAMQPTFGIITNEDPEDFTKLTLYLFYGNWDMLRLIQIGLPLEIGREIGPNALSMKTCRDALKAAKADQNGVNRANENMDALQGAADTATGIDPEVLGAIGLRESDFISDRVQKGGHGRGTFQFDCCGTEGARAPAHPQISEDDAFDVGYAAYAATVLLQSSLNQYGYMGAMALPSAIRNYNAGSTYTVGKAFRGIPDLDKGTTGSVDKTHGNYVSNVLALVDCFQ